MTLGFQIWKVGDTIAQITKERGLERYGIIMLHTEAR